MPPDAPLPAPAARRPPGLLGGLAPARRALCYGLVALLVLIRLFEDELCAGLEAGWQRLSGLLPAPAWLSAANAAAQRSLQRLTAHPHSVAVELLYDVTYVGLCIGLLCALLPAGRGWRWSLRIYGGFGLASLLLILLGQVAGLPLLTNLASQLLHGLLSPLPLMVLVPLLWLQSAQPATDAAVASR
ncbi:MAG TPA: hypothetical protein VFO93_05430 [Hymenobacter sp.]|uniref:XrtX-associated membrane protein n=1 Tax=Hymenobacter sp. TaxID=1898978 RepID=UPI002D7E46BD|nr:hypothetical protein [Hymenobacter sp.]HET9502959.1 hypothetical protein [Hymenobacter sp.]